MLQHTVYVRAMVPCVCATLSTVLRVRVCLCAADTIARAHNGWRLWANHKQTTLKFICVFPKFIFHWIHQFYSLKKLFALNFPDFRWKGNKTLLVSVRKIDQIDLCVSIGKNVQQVSLCKVYGKGIDCEIHKKRGLKRKIESEKIETWIWMWFETKIIEKVKRKWLRICMKRIIRTMKNLEKKNWIWIVVVAACFVTASAS